MPEYLITDPETGRRLQVSGPTKPSQEEAGHIFKQITPHSLIGAPEGMLSSAMGALVQHPGDLMAAAQAAKGEAHRIVAGDAPNSLSGQLAKMKVPSNGVADFAMDLQGDPMNVLGAGESALENMGKNLIEHTPAAIRATRTLYTRLVEDVLSQMNRPLPVAGVERLIDRAGISAEAVATGFKAWLRAQGKGLVTRGTVLKRLLQEQEFRRILAEHLPAHVRPLSLAPDLQDRLAPQEAGMTSHPMWQAILPMMAALGGLAPEWKSPAHGLKGGASRLFDAAEVTANTKPLAPEADDRRGD